jgi:hypothetical protein
MRPEHSRCMIGPKEAAEKMPDWACFGASLL